MAKVTRKRQPRKAKAPAVAAPEERQKGRILVPVVDATGKPLPAWRVARWHLIVASNLLGSEYMRTRGEDPRAEDFALASAIASQLFMSLAGESQEILPDGTRISTTKKDRAAR